ncbi:MAG: hypothetical protein KC458_07500 [Dehalococcoidia bacterium]|nr:hypothetical protein [Dehalococcoidia bacterium]
MTVYRNLTDEQIIDLAHSIPERDEVKDFHKRVRDNRAAVNGTHPIKIPESHKNVFAGLNYEGSNRLNTRVTQLASFLSKGRMRFSIVPPGADDGSRAGAAAQERFARNGEVELAKGTALHNWKHETYRDIGESGVSIVQQMPRREFYIQAEQNPSLMADGSLIDEVFYRRRIDPLSFSFDSTPGGKLGCAVLSLTRTLSELAGLDSARLKDASAYFNEPFDPEVPTTMTGKSAKVREVWWEDGGALVLMDAGTKLSMKAALGPEKKDGARILHHWKNQLGKPPFYIAAHGTPWFSPLVEMIQLTQTRNYWATMQDIQASGAIFRNWQLIDKTTQEDVTYTHPSAKSLPEAVIYDPSKPPPYMGPDTEWKLAPFEFHDVSNRYAQIQVAHENAGSSVARLMGEAMGPYTAVGTADAMDDAAQGEFAMLIESIEARTAEMWTDAFRWLKEHHGDPVKVFDHGRVSDSNKFMRTVTDLKGEDVVSLHVRSRLDLRSRLAMIADFRYAMEAINAGFMDFDRAVEEGLIPYVDDADVEKLALYISELERVETMKDLRELSQDTTDPRYMTGRMSDPRGTGTGQGPLNVSGSGVSAGGSDTAAGRAA